MSIRPKGILVDATKCVGCGECVTACQQANRQPPHPAERFDHQTFTFLARRGEELHVRRLCMHCLDPACVSVCPVAALRRTPGGAVTYDPTRCIGCRYCLVACPFGVPAYEWHSPRPLVRKCELCAGRREGPACTAACPAEATLTGPRADLIGEARRRLAAEPGSYHPHIFGLTEVGGTGVIVIGPRPPAALGFPARIGQRPMPELTWAALQHVPEVVIFGGVLLTGLHWLTHRKAEVRRREGGETAPRRREGAGEGGGGQLGRHGATAGTGAPDRRRQGDGEGDDGE